MAQLLAIIARGELLSGSGSSLLLETMARCETGPDRIKGLMPAETRVAHKTGLIANPLDTGRRRSPRDQRRRPGCPTGEPGANRRRYYHRRFAAQSSETRPGDRSARATNLRLLCDRG